MATRKALAPAEIIKRLEDLGAKTRVLSGTAILVYPADPESNQPVVKIPMKIRGGNELPNIIAQLRRIGHDLFPDEPEIPTKEPAVPTPADIAKQTNGRPRDTRFDEMVKRHTAPDPTPDIADGPSSEDQDVILEMLAEAQAAVKALDRAVLDLTGEVRSLQRRQGESEREINELRRKVFPVPIGEKVQEEVLAHLMSTPGMKWSPQLIEANIGDRLPEGRSKTAVAGACKRLVEAGKIRGGGTNGEESQETRGIYWYEEEATAD